MRPELPAVCQVMRCVKDATVVHPVIVGTMLAEMPLCEEHMAELFEWITTELEAKGYDLSKSSLGRG